tara:strand:+ start:1790 stop:2149 length:360 start_codon:yes stop_codon:yes gene_type:complete
MAKVIVLPVFEDSRGSLAVIENILPFSVNRIYFIYDILRERGGHRHAKTIQAMISLGGETLVFTDNGKSQTEFLLDSPEKCLILEPEDWHTMSCNNSNPTILVMASEPYDKDDYIYERY